jgi:hypothetical protein
MEFWFETIKMNLQSTFLYRSHPIFTVFHLANPANRRASLTDEQEGKRWGVISGRVRGVRWRDNNCVTIGNEKYSQNYSIPCTVSHRISLRTKHFESPPSLKETVSISWSERLYVEINTNLVAATAVLYVL